MLLAGGVGTRTGLDLPKQFLEIDGLTLLEICYARFVKSKIVDNVVIVCNQQYFELVESICSKYQLPFKIAEAGNERANSVMNGLLRCKSSTKYVAIHDSARANVSIELIHKLFKSCVSNECGVIPGYHGSDSIKLVDKSNNIVKTLDRNLVFKVQTPQVFPFKKILESYKHGMSNCYNGTDCSSYYEQLYNVKIVDGDTSNIKLTFAKDITDLKKLLKS